MTPIELSILSKAALYMSFPAEDIMTADSYASIKVPPSMGKCGKMGTMSLVAKPNTMTSTTNGRTISSFAFRKIADPEYLPKTFFTHAQEILYRNIGRFIQGAAQKTVCIPLIILIDPASVPKQP